MFVPAPSGPPAGTSTPLYPSKRRPNRRRDVRRRVPRERRRLPERDAEGPAPYLWRRRFTGRSRHIHTNGHATGRGGTAECPRTRQPFGSLSNRLVLRMVSAPLSGPRATGNADAWRHFGSKKIWTANLLVGLADGNAFPVLVAIATHLHLPPPMTAGLAGVQEARVATSPMQAAPGCRSARPNTGTLPHGAGLPWRPAVRRPTEVCGIPDAAQVTCQHGHLASVVSAAGPHARLPRTPQQGRSVDGQADFVLVRALSGASSSLRPAGIEPATQELTRR
jgi:hypothetical protein